MKESIKKQPPDWKKIVLLIAGWLALAALGGLVAAAVFAVTEPKIAEAVTREEPPAKVDCTLDLVWQLLPYRLQYNTLRFQRAIKVRCRSTAVDQKVRSRDKCPSVAHK